MPLDAINYTGKNFAPTAPLQDVKKTATKTEDNSSSIAAFAREQWQGLYGQYEQQWREVTEQARTISLLRSGKLTIKGDLDGTGFVVFPRNRNKDRSNYPVFAQVSEIVTAKWGKVNTIVRSRNFGDGYKAEIMLNQADTVIRSYFSNIFTSVYKTREAYSAQDYGTYVTQFQYDDDLNQMMKVVPVIQNQPKVMVPGYGACYDCGKEGHPSDFAQTDAPYPQCPDCGSFRTSKMVPDATADSWTVNDVNTVSQGDITGGLLDYGACRHDPRVFPHESDYFLYSDRVPLRMIHKMFGEGIQVEGRSSEDFEFQIMDALAARGGSSEGHGASDLYELFGRFTEEGVRRNMWLKPAQYAGFKLKKSENTIAGRIPADVDFAELFPKGMCFRGFNDMKLIVEISAEKANIASGVYLYQSHSGMGKGVSDAVDIAKDLNEVYSMAMAGLKRYGAAGLVIDKKSGLTQRNVRDIFRPEKAVFADTQNNSGDINKMIQQIHPTPINPVLPQMMIQLNNMLNLAFGTGDFSSGAVQDVDINTLGGQQLAHAKAEEQKGGIYSRLNFHRELSALIIWDIFCERIKFPRWYTPGQDQHYKLKGKWICGADMPKDLKFDAVPDSEIPENKFEKQMARGDMMEKAGGLAMFAQANAMDPKLTAWYAEGYGIELPGNSDEENRIVCLGRLANIQELSGMYQDPEQILSLLDTKLRVREDGHIAKADFLGTILDDDEVSTWNPVEQATVELLIERHYQLEAEAQYRNESIKQSVANELAGQQAQANTQIAQPQIQQQQQLQGQQQQAEQAAQTNQAVMGAAADVGGRVLDDEQNQVDANREEEAKNNDAVRANVLAQQQHERQMELEGMKIKASAANKTAPVKAAATRK